MLGWVSGQSTGVFGKDSLCIRKGYSALLPPGSPEARAHWGTSAWIAVLGVLEEHAGAEGAGIDVFGGPGGHRPHTPVVDINVGKKTIGARFVRQ